MQRILILSTYPAPYRKELFDKFKAMFDVDIFFEKPTGDARADEWFSKGNYFLLNTEEGRRRYNHSLHNIKQYSLVVAYEYSTKEEIKLILKARSSRVPYAINADGVMMATHGSVFRNLLKKYLISGASGCLASGKNATDYFLKYGAGKDKIYQHTFSTLNEDDILENPVTRDKQIELRKKLNLPVNKKIAVAVGRFIPLKRYFELIQVWKVMPEEFVLLLIGGGEEEEKYRKCIFDNNLNNVLIENFHAKNELFEYYKASDVFVHPTSYDVWGLVVNEAMASGLPALVSDRCVAGIELIEDGENGYLVEMGNDTDMCEKTLWVLKNDVLRQKMSQNAIKTIKPYTLEHMAETQISAFKKILNER